MSAVPSTPFPIPAFNSSNNTTPAEFLKFLRSLVSQYLGDDCPRITENKIAWVTIVDGLADHFLGSFPLPDMVAWSTMEEKVVMTEVTLDVTKRVFSRVNDIYNGSEILLKKVIVRLLDLCRALDVWMEMDVICGDETFLPSHMKERAFDAVVSVLRGMGSNDPILSGEDNPSWKVLRAILEECIEIGRDLVAPTTPLTSCTIFRFFQKPRIVALKDQSSQEQEAH
ncbi:hypothetical protein BDN70DRAFT_30460 [Pholiota conissans]|uniref:Uncharacterized protein n=1 Tax=Pholiota conissans TaxID=109636 RepID=A0A9P6CZS4_9AGAR|nr:hypothetical protein BDN70DRAFT_30460 [Pholiota conissans]